MKGSHRRSRRHKAKAGPAPLHQRLRSPVHPSCTSSNISDTPFPKCTFTLYPHTVPTLFPQHHIKMFPHCLLTRLSFKAQDLGLLTFIVSLCPLGEYITHRPSNQVYFMDDEQRRNESRRKREREPSGKRLGWEQQGAQKVLR